MPDTKGHADAKESRAVQTKDKALNKVDIGKVAKNTSHSVIKQASFLMIATLICRVIGLLYRSPLHNIMGDVGDGYYSLAYEWYNIILLLASYSIPMAVSKVMSELLAVKQYRNAQRVFHAAFLYAVVVGGAGALVAYFGAPVFLSTQPDAVLALRVLAPTIFLSGLLGVLRGYFQAQNTMLPTSLSQIGEQIINAVISVVAAWLFTCTVVGDENVIGRLGAAGGTLGTGAGVVAGLVIMVFIYFYNKKIIDRRIRRDVGSPEKSFKDIFKMILLMVTPVILATCVYNLSGIVDQLIFTRIMSAKDVDADTVSTAYALFGYQFKPILNIPIALASATSTALIPTIAGLGARKEYKEAENKIHESVSFMMFLAIPCMIGMMVLSYPIIRILYPGSHMDDAALTLTIGSISVIFYCLSTVTNGILQGMGHPSLPVKNSLIALAVNALSLAVFTLMGLGVYALLLATILYAITVSFFNGLSLKKYIPYRQDVKRSFVLPFAAAGAMGCVVGALYWVPALLLKGIFSSYIVNALWTVLVVLVGMLTYIIAFVMISGYSEAELKKLPFGTRMCQILHLLHIPIRGRKDHTIS